MKYYFVKLLPPRPTFAQDMTEVERALMHEHIVYWQARMAEGSVVAYGPVADPKGGYGLGILKLADDADVSHFCAGDPTVLANVGFAYEVFVMPRLVTPS
ncbi:MAG TPA: YciI family protein [Polyangiaceae bacterium]